MTGPTRREDLLGGAWLLADMSLNIWALSIVKWLGADYPPSQIVFIRAATGLVLLSPFLLKRRADFARLDALHIHALRVALSLITLTTSFFVLPRVPLALFTAIGFTRPLVTMFLAALLLRERIVRRHWIAAALALAGIVIAVQPDALAGIPALAALCVVVLAGSGAIIATRRLRAAPVAVMMAFYTGGLALGSAPFAWLAWTPIDNDHLLPVLVIGVFSQAAQFCFLRAHFHGSAGFLSVLSYTSLVISSAVGYVVFDEVPGWHFGVGAALVITAAIWATSSRGRDKTN